MANPSETRDLSIVRSFRSLLAAPQGHSGRWLILDQRAARYIVLPEAAGRFLMWLTAQPLGVTIAEIRTFWPVVGIARLAELGLVDLVPPMGSSPGAKLVAEFYVINIVARAWFALAGWRAVAGLMRQIPTEYTGQIQTARPLLFDQIEVAAQCAMCLPGTRRLCTIVALTCALMLRRRGVAAHIVIMSTSDLPEPHAFVVVESHRIDPGQEQVSGPLLQPLHALYSGTGRVRSR